MSTKIRVADYVARTLAEHGVRHVFMVTGGGAMHLNDAFGRVPELTWVPCHHEQACAMAAQAYFRLSGKIAAVNVTTGPGGTNAITGVYGAFVDSLGMIVVSGQVKWETLVRSTGLPLRQLGDQEVDITRIVAPITKYAVMVTDPLSIRYHLERALYLATSGRPGPTWIDIPMNVQGTLIDPDRLSGYDRTEDASAVPTTDVIDSAREIVARLRSAKRPVIVPGSGVRISGAYDTFRKIVDRLGVPVATAFNAHDLLPNDHPAYVGRPGTVGDRPGNFAVQNADFVLVLGCRLNIRQISYNWSSFARAAFKAMVDIDAAELKKPTLAIDLPIHADLGLFLSALDAIADEAKTPAHADYLAWCKARLARYPTVLPEYRDTASPVNPYCFGDRLFALLGDDDVVVTGDGTACVTTFQAATIRGRQRLFSDSGSAPMGYDLPAAIGASFARTSAQRRIACVAGDGSIMMNLQELETIATQRLPVTIFIMNNDGYHSIRQTQAAYFPDNPVGCGPESRVGFPEFSKVAAAFGLPYRRIDRHDDLDAGIAEALAHEGPSLCEVFLDKRQPFAPKLSSRKLDDGRMVTSPLEDLAPFLSREELAENMIIPILEE